MPDPTPKSQTIRIDKTLYPTTNTKLAAALLTLGVPFFDPSVPPVSNVYSEEKPFKSANLPGKVTYHLAGSTELGDKVSSLEAAWEGRVADRELDLLIEELVAKDPDIGLRLRKLLPLALMAYARGFYENRERLLDLWKRATPMVCVKRGECSFALVSRNASLEMLRHLGIA